MIILAHKLVGPAISEDASGGGIRELYDTIDVNQQPLNRALNQRTVASLTAAQGILGAQALRVFPTQFLKPIT